MALALEINRLISFIGSTLCDLKLLRIGHNEQPPFLVDEFRVHKRQDG